MSYLRFDKLMLTNIDKSLTKEFLSTNINGAYMSSSIVDCNTRKYHGYLVVPLSNIGEYNHVLLSSIDETIIQHNTEFNLGVHQYPDGYFAPKGHKYIREFFIDEIPTTIYRVGGIILKKERLICQNENRVMIRYTLLEANSHTTIRLKPFLAFRGVHFLTHENDNINREYEIEENGVSFCLYDNYPKLKIQTNKKSKYIHQPHWNKDIEYYKEKERGLYYKEDLFVPGYFESNLKVGEGLIISAGVEPISPRVITKVFNKEIKNNISRNNFENTLKRAAKDFFVKKDDNKYIIAGYPWFNYRTRDALLSLPGMTLSIGDIDRFEEYFNVIQNAICDYLNSKEYSTYYVYTYSPDCILWFIWNIQQYAKYTSIEDASDRYGEILLRIIDFITKQNHANLFLHDNGLLYSNGKEISVSWMNATENEKPITPRTGYIVEFNALWYNALMFATKIAVLKNDNNTAQALKRQAEKTKKSFVTEFWNGKYLYDYIDGYYKDLEVRPNMIYAVSLPYSPLTQKQQKSILDIVTTELLTIKGLRTISPKSGMYRPLYRGGLYERNRNYHNGPVWAFTIGAYADAYIKIYRKNAYSFLRKFLSGFENELKELTIGTLSELYDGNPPFKGHGAMAYAPTIAEVLRTTMTINKGNI